MDDGAPVRLVGRGDPTPLGPGLIVQGPSVNDTGAVAFAAAREALYVLSGGAVRTVLRGGDVVAGAGISALPRYLADPALAAGQLEILHRPIESTINTLHLAMPSRVPPTPATNAVVARLLEKAREWDSL